MSQMPEINATDNQAVEPQQNTPKQESSAILKKRTFSTAHPNQHTSSTFILISEREHMMSKDDKNLREQNATDDGKPRQAKNKEEGISIGEA